MKIEYNETDRTFKIDDNLKGNHFLLKFIMICNVIQGILWPLKSENGFMKWFWILMGSFSLVLLLYFIFKKSTAERIAVNQVDALQVKSRLGRMRYFLKLKNGKERDLMGDKLPAEIERLKDVMRLAGVRMA